MQIKVRFLDGLKVQAEFDEFKIISDQPIRYKGEGTAPGPFDYFLASSAMCAAYFVKVYCEARQISTDDIIITQDNIVDPENRYQQRFVIKAQIPESISSKDREGILKSIERCSVKKVIQEGPQFEVEAETTLGQDDKLLFEGIPRLLVI
jgi:ribosomal protein S12 methylthiotransferase accessory factor